MKAVDIDGNDHEVGLDEISWRVHVYAVIIKDDKVLLSPQHDGYDLPGGKVDLGESVKAGLVREVKEETGIDVEVNQLLGVSDTLFKVTFREPQEVWHSVMLYYLCDEKGGEISDANFDEHEKNYARLAEWVDVEKVYTLKQASSVDFAQYIRKAVEIYGNRKNN